MLFTEKEKYMLEAGLFDELSEIILKYNEENYLLPGSDVLSPRIENKLNDLEIKWTKARFK